MNTCWNNTRLWVCVCVCVYIYIYIYIYTHIHFNILKLPIFRVEMRANNTWNTFFDRMTVHRNRFLVNKTNRCTEFQFYWYYDSTRFGQPFCPSSGVLKRTSALVHFMQLWWPFATSSSSSSRMELRSILLLVANGHHNCIKCTKGDVG